MLTDTGQYGHFGTRMSVLQEQLTRQWTQKRLAIIRVISSDMVMIERLSCNNDPESYIICG